MADKEIETTEPTTRVFKNKQELALSLLGGEKWRVKGVTYGYCCFTEETKIQANTKIPFRYIIEEDKIDTDLDGFWDCADGITEWERVIL